MISSQLAKPVGYTHASSVMPLVKSSDAASLTTTTELDPLKANAFPKRPVLTHVAPLIAPALRKPEESATVVPLPSSKPYAATRPPMAGGLEVGGSELVGGNEFVDGSEFVTLGTV